MARATAFIIEQRTLDFCPEQCGVHSCRIERLGQTAEIRHCEGPGIKQCPHANDSSECTFSMHLYAKNFQNGEAFQAVPFTVQVRQPERLVKLLIRFAPCAAHEQDQGPTS